MQEIKFQLDWNIGECSYGFCNLLYIKKFSFGLKIENYKLINKNAKHLKKYSSF